MIVDIPNVGQVNFPDSMSESEVNAAAKRLFDESTAPEVKEGIGTALRRGAEQFVSSGQTALESITKGGEEAAIRAQERQADIQRRLGSGASLERLQQIYKDQGILPAAKELGSQILPTIVEQVPNIGATLGGAAAGAAAGSLAGPVGTVIGGIGGALAPSFVQQYGGNIQRQAEAQTSEGKPLDINRGVAAGTAVPQAGLEVLGTLIPLGGNIVTKILGPTVGKLIGATGSKIADEALLTTIAKGTAKGIAFEVPTEVTQQILERAQAGLSLTNDDALKEYGQTAFVTSLLGPLGIIGRVSDKAQASRDLALAQQKAAETGEPQQVPLQLTYDPTVSGVGGTVDLTPFTVFPDGRVAPTDEAAFQEQFKRTYPLGSTEAYAIPGDKEAVMAARMEEARKYSPAMQKINAIYDKKQKEVATQQAKVDSLKAQQSAFTNAPMEGGVIRPVSPEVMAAEQAKLASYADTKTLAVMRNKKIDFFEGIINDNGRFSGIDPATGKKVTFNPNSANVVVNPTERDIVTLENKFLDEDLKAISKEIKDAEKSVAQKATNFEEWIKKNPIKESEIADTLPNALEVRAGGKGTKIAAGARKYFSKKGSQTDDLALRAVEDGVMTQEELDSPGYAGGINAFLSKLEAAYNKETIATPENRDALAQIDSLYNQQEQLQAEIDRRQAELNQTEMEPVVSEQQVAPIPESIPPATVPTAQIPTAAQAEQLAPALQPSFRAEVPYEFSVQAKRDMAKIIPRLTKVLDRMGLQNIGLNLAKNLKANIDGKITKVNGTYLNRIITLCLDNRGIEATLHHEVIHALKEMGMFSQREWATLSKIAKDKWIDQYNIDARYPNASQEVKIEEAIASAFPDYMKQVGQPRGLLQRIKDFVQKVGNVFRGLGYNSPESVFAKTESGKLTGEGVQTTGKLRAEQPSNVIDFNKFKADTENAIARSRPMIMESLDAQLQSLQKAYDQNLITDKDINDLRQSFAKYDNDALMAISAIKRKVNEVTKKPELRAEVPTRKKFKAPMQGVDPAYAEMLRQQFTQEQATVKERMEGLKANFFERMMIGVFDEFRTIKKYDPTAYMMARLSKSIDGGLQGLLEHGQVFLRDGALDIRPNTKGLLKILEPVGTEVDQYQSWKALSRDANLPADKRSFPADLVAGREQLVKGTLNGQSRKAIYEKALREENELNKSVLQVALDTGLIDKQGYDNFANDIYYIPFYKMMEDGDVQSVSAAAKLTGQQFSKTLKGGEKKVNDLMENVLLNWSHILSAAMKNQAAVKTIDAAQRMGAAESVNAMDGKYPKDSVKVMKDGKVIHYELSDPDLVDAISTISYLGPKSQFLDIARGFTNALRYGITMSPAYKVRNLIRDSIQSAAISELGPNMFSNVYNGLAMSKDGNPTFMSALAGGGIFEMGTAHEGNQAKLIKRLIDKGVNANHILDTTDKIKGKLQDALNWYNEQGNKFENANRLALYQKLIDSGKSHLEASYAARDLMDFSMQGQFRAIKIVGSVVPFFNARLQGLYKLGRDGITPFSRVIYNATTGKPIDVSDKQKAMRFATMSGAVMLTSLALYDMYKDDEDFKRREDWDRDNFWWFKIGDTAYRIPRPFEIGALGTIAERTYEQIADEGVEGKVFADRMNRILMDTLSLNPTPQMIKPLIDLYANKDSFTGAPIESAGMQNLSKQERVNNNTSGVAIALGGITSGAAKILTFNPQAQGFSPVQIDYSIKAYLGWLGATAASTADLAVEPFSEGTKVRKPVIDTIAMGFIKTEPEIQSKYMTQFYQNNANLQSALADMRHYAELGDSEKVQKIMEEKGNDIALAKVYDKTSKQLATLRQQSRLIENNKTIPAEERRAEMVRLKILMSTLAEQAESMRKQLNK